MEKKTSKDIVVGAKFGRWTILEINVKNPNSKAKNPPRTALCQCECGKTRYKENYEWKGDYFTQKRILVIQMK